MNAPTHERKSSLDGLAVATLLMCCTFWGLGQVATKVALAQIPPLLQAGLRAAIAVALVVAWSRWRGVALFQRDGSLGAGVLAGVLFAGEFACIFLGLQHTSASRMTVFVYTAPFVVALGMPLIARGERLGTLQWAGLAIAFAGVAFAFAEGFSGQAPAGPRQWLGDALGIGAALLWGATTLVVRASRLATLAPEKTLAWQLALCALLLVPAGLALGEPWPTRLEGWPLVAFAFQSVTVTFLTFLLWFWLVRHYPATKVAAFTLLTPLMGTLFGVLLLGEPLTARLAVAAVAVALGIWMVNRPAQRPQEKKP
ncbi:MAG: DMT family transporter [Rubrivivax sp.]